MEKLFPQNVLDMLLMFSTTKQVILAGYITNILYYYTGT